MDAAYSYSRDGVEAGGRLYGCLKWLNIRMKPRAEPFDPKRKEEP